MKNSAVLITVAVLLVGSLAIWYFGFRENPLSVTTVVQDDPLVTPVTPYVEDDLSQPINADAAAQEPPLPALEESDPWVRERLTGRDPWLDKILNYENLVRKITVAGDLILRNQNPNSQLFFLKPVEELTVTHRDTRYFLSEKSYARFDHAISIFESLDSETLAFTYKLAQPLFEAAWNELGNGSQWDAQVDPLLERILAVQPVDGDIELFKSGGLYLYADNQLEALPPLNKAFIRMGRENMNRIQRKLISIREHL